MAAELPSSDFTAATDDVQLFSEDGGIESQHTDLSDEAKGLEDDGLPAQPAKTSCTKQNQQQNSIKPLPNLVEAAPEPTIPTIAPSKYDTMKATLQDLEATQASLFRQLHQQMIIKSQTQGNVTSSIAEQSSSNLPLPSMAAHTIRNPPLSKEQCDAAMAFAHSVIQHHIRLLQQYNQIRDIGQGLIGMVADRRRVRVQDCQEEFGVVDGD
jgi:hypothetical protein